MAKDDDRPQFNPKHRIAGAIILVSLAVIFVPMLFDESAPPVETRALTEIPERNAGAETRVVVAPVLPADAPVAPVPAQTVAPALETPAAVPTARIETAKTEPTKPAPIAAVDKRDNAATAKPVAVKRPEASGKGWVVQVGTFANQQNADRLRDNLKRHGFAVNAQTVTVNGGKAVRVHVGPYRDKPAATRAQAKLKKELNVQGMVRAYP